MADERMLAVFDNDNIRRSLHLKRRDCVPKGKVLDHLWLTGIPVQLVKTRFRWFGHAVRRPVGELLRDLLYTPPLSWRK